MAAMTTVVKNVHERTSKDEQVRQVAERVQAMLRDKQESTHQEETEQYDR
jgi:hypothetical protein